MKRYAVWLAPVVLMFGSVACLKPAANGAGGQEVVRWPHLKALDTLAEKAESAGATGPIADIRELGGQIKGSASQVAQDALPAGAHEPEQVRQLQKDLGSLAQSLGDPAALPEADLRSTIQGFHPIVEKLMEASGMPHVHEHPPEKGAADAK